MDKYDYIESLLMYIKGFTGINFQLQVQKIFYEYYKSKGKIYEMPDFYGGDQKNDGWVVEDSLFFQIFSPTRLKKSLKKEIEEKFQSDLSGLLKIVYEEKKWNGEVKEFVFIVNTLDNNIPHDSDRFFDKVVVELQEKYQCKFEYKMTNCDYIKDLLYDIDDIEILKKISSSFHLLHMIDCNAITETVVIDLIVNISNNVSEKYIMKKYEKAYDRISSIKKIELNDLVDKRDEIENIISNLDVVEKAVNTINQDILNENKFERVKTFIIDKYTELADKYHGVELYNEIVQEMLKCTNKRWDLETPMKFLIVYVFDKCDIFEKE